MENEREIKKFKDKQALERAYVALEREFTRKCQRLRELERLLGTMEENPHRARGAIASGTAAFFRKRSNLRLLPQRERTTPTLRSVPAGKF